MQISPACLTSHFFIPCLAFSFFVYLIAGLSGERCPEEVHPGLLGIMTTTASRTPLLQLLVRTDTDFAMNTAVLLNPPTFPP